MRIVSLAISVLAVGLAGLGAGCGDDGGGTVADAKPPPSCESYCQSITANCTGQNQQYASMAGCMAVCTSFPPGTGGDTAGNSLGCRAYHAGAAASGPDVHCGHAGPGGNSACGLNCEGFCTIVLHTCTGASAQYGGNMGVCLNSCNGFATTPAYNASVQTGNSFACRLYHATAATLDPATHCGHTAATSAPCGP